MSKITNDDIAAMFDTFGSRGTTGRASTCVVPTNGFTAKSGQKPPYEDAEAALKAFKVELARHYIGQFGMSQEAHKATMKDFNRFRGSITQSYARNGY